MTGLPILPHIPLRQLLRRNSKGNHIEFPMPHPVTMYMLCYSRRYRCINVLRCIILIFHCVVNSTKLYITWLYCSSFCIRNYIEINSKLASTCWCHGHPNKTISTQEILSYVRSFSIVTQNRPIQCQLCIVNSADITHCRIRLY